MKTRKPSRIVWAVDALIEDKELFARTVKVLKAWAHETPAEIEPVYVLSPTQLSMPEPFFSIAQEPIEKSIRETFHKLVKKAAIPGMKAPCILVSPDHSLRSAVRTLVRHAGNTGADLIVASTLSRKGATRFLFGSFAESLVLQSEIPIFLVSPRTEPTKRFRHILFPTDLSAKSEVVFERVVDLAVQHRAKITLFHKVEYLTDLSESALATLSYQDFLEKDLLSRHDALTRLVDRARARGVDAELVTDEHASSIADAILRAAKRGKVNLIALASQTGPIVSALLGSVTRQIIRKSDYPVWVVHPSEEAKAIRSDSTFERPINDAITPEATRAMRLAK